MAKRYTEDELYALLKNRFANINEYVVMRHVPNGTGALHESWVDGMVVSMWPSNGLKWMAFEFKSDRSDFLREISNPKKNAWAKESCHEFWFVATSDVIKEEELPAGVGWMKPHGDSLAIVRHASFKEPVLSTSLVCAFLRASEQNFRADAKQMVAEDHNFKEAKEYKIGVEEFLHKRDMGSYGLWLPERGQPIKDQVVKILNDAMKEKGERKSAERAAHIVHNFKKQIFDLLHWYVVLSAFTIDQTDEFGHSIISEWGGQTDTMTKIAFNELAPKADKKKIAELKKLMKTWLEEERHKPGSLMETQPEENKEGKEAPDPEKDSENG